MDAIFKHQIKIAIDRLKENSFQNFVDELYLKKFGSDFTPIKQKRDKGCDGIVKNNGSLAVYAPEKYTLRSFKKKVKEDHENYIKNWKNELPKWRVVYNGEFTAEMFKFVDSLENGSKKIGIAQIIDDIDGLNWVHQRAIAEYLGINEQFFINDLLQNVINDLLKNAKAPAKILLFQKPTYIEDKIQLNFNSNDVENAKIEYLNSLGSMGKLKVILKSYDDEEVAALKNKVIIEYGKLSGDFKTRLNNLTAALSGNHNNDQQYKYYVRVVLLYMFEICLIGKRSEAEK